MPVQYERARSVPVASFGFRALQVVVYADDLALDDGFVAARADGAVEVSIPGPLEGPLHLLPVAVIISNLVTVGAAV